jgi:hypothetical protein
MAPSGMTMPEFIAIDDDRSKEASERFFGLEGSINPIFR